MQYSHKMHVIFSQDARNILTRCTQYSRKMHAIFSQDARNILTRCTQYSQKMHAIFSQDARNILIRCTQYSHKMYVIFSQDVRNILTRCTQYSDKMHAIFWQDARNILTRCTQYYAIFWQDVRNILTRCTQYSDKMHAIFWQDVRNILTRCTQYSACKGVVPASQIAARSPPLTTAMFRSVWPHRAGLHGGECFTQRITYIQHNELEAFRYSFSKLSELDAHPDRYTLGNHRMGGIMYNEPNFNSALKLRHIAMLTTEWRKPVLDWIMITAAERSWNMQKHCRSVCRPHSRTQVGHVHSLATYNCVTLCPHFR